VHQLWQSELSGDESILWTGQPNPKVIFRREDIFRIPFSLMWGGFAIFWEAMVLGLHPWGGEAKAPFDWFFVLWGIPFVLVGQYMIWGRFVYDAWKKRRIFYAVTTRRVLALDTSRRARRLSAAFIDQLPVIRKTVRSDGIGSLAFGPVPPNARQSHIVWNQYHVGAVPVFRDIDGAENVYRLVLRQREERSSGKNW